MRFLTRNLYPVILNESVHNGVSHVSDMATAVNEVENELGNNLRDVKFVFKLLQFMSAVFTNDLSFKL